MVYRYPYTLGTNNPLYNSKKVSRRACTGTPGENTGAVATGPYEDEADVAYQSTQIACGLSSRDPDAAAVARGLLRAHGGGSGRSRTATGPALEAARHRTARDKPTFTAIRFPPAPSPGWVR